jgi:hypothetical protein
MEAPEGPPDVEKLSRDEPTKFMPEILYIYIYNIDSSF